MNPLVKQLYEQAHLVREIPFEGSVVDSTIVSTYKHKQFDPEKFAELIIQECTQLLFAESERLYTYSSECDNMHHSDDAELCAEKCMDNIQMIEEHFGVKE